MPRMERGGTMKGSEMRKGRVKQEKKRDKMDAGGVREEAGG